MEKEWWNFIALQEKPNGYGQIKKPFNEKIKEEENKEKMRKKKKIVAAKKCLVHKRLKIFEGNNVLISEGRDVEPAILRIVFKVTSVSCMFHTWNDRRLHK